MKPKNAGMSVYACTRAFTLLYACLYADAPNYIQRKDILPKSPYNGGLLFFMGLGTYL